MRPETESELADLIRDADGPLCISGGGTRGLAVPGRAVSVAGLNGVQLYEPGALTLVVGAGTPVAEVEALLAGEGQRLAFEPWDARGVLGSEGTPTMGALFAANISGPRRIQAGAARDFLLGVRFVDGAGQVVKNGGRVMKNVTGYDLVKLMAGAHGTLGVLSEVSLKVLPQPETEATVFVEGVDAGIGISALSAALGSPFDVTGAAYDPDRRAAMVRVEGFETSVAYRGARLAEMLGTYGPVRVGPATGDLWAGIRDVAAFQGRTGDVWRISVKPSQAAAAAAALGGEAGDVAVQFDWGGGLIWALAPGGTDLRARLSVPGHATLVRADAATRAALGVFSPQPAPLEKIAAGLRARFDPRGILNPGLMG